MRTLLLSFKEGLLLPVSRTHQVNSRSNKCMGKKVNNYRYLES